MSADEARRACRSLKGVPTMMGAETPFKPPSPGALDMQRCTREGSFRFKEVMSAATCTASSFVGTMTMDCRGCGVAASSESLVSVYASHGSN